MGSWGRRGPCGGRRRVERWGLSVLPGGRPGPLSRRHDVLAGPQAAPEGGGHSHSSGSTRTRYQPLPVLGQIRKASASVSSSLGAQRHRSRGKRVPSVAAPSAGRQCGDCARRRCPLSGAPAAGCRSAPPPLRRRAPGLAAPGGRERQRRTRPRCWWRQAPARRVPSPRRRPGRRGAPRSRSRPRRPGCEARRGLAVDDQGGAGGLKRRAAPSSPGRRLPGAPCAGGERG